MAGVSGVTRPFLPFPVFTVTGFGSVFCDL